MTDSTLIVAALLGVIEGLTEFIPVSSTGHLLLAGHFLGFDSPGRAFEVLIQLGAIMAILGVYAGRLWRIFSAAPHDPRARRFILAVLIAFLPAMVVGAFAYSTIRALLESPLTVAIALVLGGVAILLIEWLITPQATGSVETMPGKTAAAVGVMQCIAMIPGVSRSGATIMGGLLLGLDRRTAAEYSFFLAVPTMAAATVYSLYQERHLLTLDGLGLIAIGFVVAFLSALLVVRWLVDFVGRHGFAPFAWYRIGLGGIALLWLLFR